MIVFESLGFKKVEYTIPMNLTENRYSLIQIVSRDTVMLNETVIYPWPTREQFKQAFMNLKVPDDDMARANRNLAVERMREEGEHMAMDGSMNYRNAMLQQQSRLYSAGQFPSNNLLNPIAWAKFIEAWKNGDFVPEVFK